MNRLNLFTGMLCGLFLLACHSPDSSISAAPATAEVQAHHDEHDSKQTRIDPVIAEEAGIRTAPAGPATIADEHEVQGLLTPIEGRSVQITARFPGVIKRLSVGIGDSVKAGQPIAMIESNLSLSNYNLVSPISGTVLRRDASLGSAVSESSPLYEITDLSSLWVDLHIFGTDAGHIEAGAVVTVTRLSDGISLQTTLDRVLPGTATASQSTVARAIVSNQDGLWRPGSAVKAHVTVARHDVPLAIPLSALQWMDGEETAFVQEGDTYHARPLKLGQRDAHRVEVLAGLSAGEAVVVEQSYLIKADIEKSGAVHEH